jgi:predicted nucleic acid-binding protein
VCDAVCVDTNIWEYAYVEELGIAGGDQLHKEAKAFIADLLLDASRSVALSQYQVIEILDVLRKAGVAGEARDGLYRLFCTEKCSIVPCTNALVGEAFRLSRQSGIHIYDYMVALPLRGLIQVIYTADQHFEHEHFRMVARVVNPLSWTMSEGRRPQRRTS